MATSSKRSTTRKTSPKATSHAVEFLPETDEDLLAAVNEVLAEGEFESFSDLCKAALEQFLLEDNSAPLSDSGQAANPQLTQLQQQLDRIEQFLLGSSASVTEDAKATPTAGAKSKRPAKSKSDEETAEASSPEPDLQSQGDSTISDVTLRRLSSLLQDF
jgi:hypothetical protein